MKKKPSLILAMMALILSLLCVFASCDNGNNANEEVIPPPPEKTAAEKVEDMIDAINDVNSCYEAAKAYYALTQAEQEKVYNAYTLTTTMETYASDSRIRDYLMEIDAESESGYFHDYLRNRLLNINSYTVNSQTTVVFYDESTSNYYLYIKIDYSAQNKAGGYTRYDNNAEYYIWKDTGWVDLQYSLGNGTEYIDFVKKIYTWQFDEYTRYYFTYTPTN